MQIFRQIFNYNNRIVVNPFISMIIPNYFFFYIISYFIILYRHISLIFVYTEKKFAIQKAIRSIIFQNCVLPDRFRFVRNNILSSRPSKLRPGEWSSFSVRSRPPATCRAIFFWICDPRANTAQSPKFRRTSTSTRAKDDAKNTWNKNIHTLHESYKYLNNNILLNNRP